MKKIAVLSVVVLLILSLVGCTGASGDYSVTEIDLDNAPQLVVDQATEANLERGYMLFSPNEYSELDATYILIVDESDYEALDVAQDSYESSVFRLTVDQKQNSDNAQQLDGKPVLLVKVDLELDAALVSDTNDIGYVQIRE